jgi:hypothetical protein
MLPLFIYLLQNYSLLFTFSTFRDSPCYAVLSLARYNANLRTIGNEAHLYQHRFLPLASSMQVISLRVHGFPTLPLYL